MRYLVVIKTDRNVMLVDAANTVRMPIGEPLEPGQRSQVTTAVWSERGQWTAWAVDSAEINAAREVRLHDEQSDQTGVFVESVGAFYLCPSPCGRWLSHLSPGPLGLELAISETSSGAMQVIDRGQPMFWTWSADSSQLAVHVEDRVVVTHLQAQSNRVLTSQAGTFVTPGWLPGGSVVYAVEDAIVAVGPDDVLSRIVPADSLGRFLLDPEARRLAHIEASGDRAALVVLDLVSLTSIEVTTAPVIAFFWSPSGQALAVLAAAGDGHVQWLVSDGSDLYELAPFRPSRSWASSVLPFFEQYAQSHACWSGDGTRLVAPAVDDAGQAGALIQSADRSVQSQWIPDAELAWWA